MRKIKIYCKNCNNSLSEIITEVKEEFLNFKGEEDLLPKRSFIHWKESEISTLEDVNLFTTSESVSIDDHKEIGKSYGCCGPGNLNALNQICPRCKYEIAILFSDCCMSSFVVFDTKRIIVKDFTDEQKIRKINFKQI